MLPALHVELIAVVDDAGSVTVGGRSFDKGVVSLDCAAASVVDTTSAGAVGVDVVGGGVTTVVVVRVVVVVVSSLAPSSAQR